MVHGCRADEIGVIIAVQITLPVNDDPFARPYIRMIRRIEFEAPTVGQGDDLARRIVGPQRSYGEIFRMGGK